MPGRPPPPDRFPQEAFRYDAAADRFQCPAGQFLYPRGYDAKRQHTEYVASKGVCAACALRAQCTTSRHSRAVHRYREHELVLRARWRRLWRQQIQDWLIATCQNVKLLIRALRPGPLAAAGRLARAFPSHVGIFARLLAPFSRPLTPSLQTSSLPL